jgi:hypothetical protein
MNGKERQMTRACFRRAPRVNSVAEDEVIFTHLKFYDRLLRNWHYQERRRQCDEHYSPAAIS